MPQITPTQVYKKTEAAYYLAKVALFIFWMPILAISMITYFGN
jgi:hypothetical protein